MADDQWVIISDSAPKLITLTASDRDGDPLAYSVVTQPSHGSISGEPPNVTYTPYANYMGPDFFTFKANDGKTDSNVATISIAIYSDSNIIFVSRDNWCGGYHPCFSNIQNGIGLAPASLIEITQNTYNGNIILDLDELITLRGGWNTNFTSSSSYTTIDGSITIKHGMMILEYIILK